MDYNIMPLSDASIGIGESDRIDGGRKVTNRLMELGIIEGVLLDVKLWWRPSHNHSR